LKYTVILEGGETRFGAFVPDLPGCIAVSESRVETLALIKDAIEFHLEGLGEDGAKIPAPHCTIETVEVESAVG
jgi:predicted RNase H-like HicB family nuclease